MSPRRRSLGGRMQALLIAGLLGIGACTPGAPPDAPAACDRSSGPGALGRAAWSDPDAARESLARTGPSRVLLRIDGGPELQLHVYRPASFDPRHGRIWFVLHGVQRNAAHYARVAEAAAERHGVLVVAPEYAQDAYPGNSGYTFGQAGPRPQARTERAGIGGSHADLERAFDAIRDTLGGRQPGYHLFGHSAGGQFVHRLLTFLPCARVESAVAANAGWYTLPTPPDKGAPAFPYGIRGAPGSSADLEGLLTFPLILLLGTEDTRPASEDRNLRSSRAAMAQGPHRLARGQHYHQTGESAARHLGLDFGWRLHLAAGAGHNVRDVIDSAANLQFADRDAGATAPCQTPTPAQQTRVEIEFLAPARAARRDDRAWSVRIGNQGPAPLCLAGWRLRDRSGRVAHLFPIDAPVPPGGLLAIHGPRVHASDAAPGQRANMRSASSIDPDTAVLDLEAPDGTPVARACAVGAGAEQSCVPAHSPGD